MYREDILHDGFTKHVLDILLKDGTIARVAVHHLTGLEPPESPAHDHPFSIDSTILWGEYEEEVYKQEKDGKWTKRTKVRREGDTFHIPAETIHKITKLPKGECITAVIQGEPYRQIQLHNVQDAV